MHKYQSEANKIADALRISGAGFLLSPEWRALRAEVLDRYGTRCMRCQHVPKHSTTVNVDHIKPRLHFPELALVFDNLQVLCARCNKRKGNGHAKDYRKR